MDGWMEGRWEELDSAFTWHQLVIRTRCHPVVCYVLFCVYFSRSLDVSQLVGGGTISLPLGLVNVVFFSHRLFSSLSTLMSSRFAGRQLQKHTCDSLDVGGVSGAACDAPPLEREDKAAMWTPFSVDASWLLQRLMTGLRLSLCVAATSESLFFFVSFLSFCFSDCFCPGRKKGFFC